MYYNSYGYWNIGFVWSKNFIKNVQCKVKAYFVYKQKEKRHDIDDNIVK